MGNYLPQLTDKQRLVFSVLHGYAVPLERLWKAFFQWGSVETKQLHLELHFVAMIT